MQPSRRPCICASLALAVLLCCSSRTNADTLKITSSPPGATVEIDGVPVGSTPCQIKYQGGYFHKTKSVFGERLQHAVTIRISKEGYATQEIPFTEGPFEWVNLKGRNMGKYWLLKTKTLDMTLKRTGEALAKDDRVALRGDSLHTP